MGKQVGYKKGSHNHNINCYGTHTERYFKDVVHFLKFLSRHNYEKQGSRTLILNTGNKHLLLAETTPPSKIIAGICKTKQSKSKEQ